MSGAGSKSFREEFLVCCLEITLMIFGWREWLPFALVPKSLPKAKVKGFGLTPLAKEISRLPRIDSLLLARSSFCNSFFLVKQTGHRLGSGGCPGLGKFPLPEVHTFLILLYLVILSAYTPWLWEKSTWPNSQGQWFPNDFLGTWHFLHWAFVL